MFDINCVLFYYDTSFLGMKLTDSKHLFLAINLKENFNIKFLFLLVTSFSKFGILSLIQKHCSFY